MTQRKREWAIALAGLGILTIAVSVFVVWNRRQEAKLAQGVFVPRATRLTPEALLLQQYIRINTTNPPGNETAGARFLAEQLRRAGIQSEIIESAPGRGNLYARIRGRSPDGALLLLNHIDVVPATGKWMRPPFAGSVLLNMIEGRGAIDMKGVAICQLEAFIAVAKSGKPPEHDLVFLAVADEEMGGSLGTKWLLAHRPDIFEGVRYALNEGGITEMQRERLSYFGIETGAKATIDLDVTARSREALEAARIALEPYFDPRDPARVLPGVRRYFESIAPTRVEIQQTLTDIDKTIASGKFWLVPEMYRFLLTDTLRVFAPQRNVDGTWSMQVYLSDLPDEQPAGRIAWLAATVKPFGCTIGTIRHEQAPAPISDDRTPLFARISAEAKRQYGGVPVGPIVLALSSNDSRFLRARGITCYGVQPFRTDFFQSLSIHGIDERVRVDWFSDGVALMKRIVAGYAADTE